MCWRDAGDPSRVEAARLEQLEHRPVQAADGGGGGAGQGEQAAPVAASAAGRGGDPRRAAAGAASQVRGGWSSRMPFDSASHSFHPRCRSVQPRMGVVIDLLAFIIIAIVLKKLSLIS